MKDHIEEYFAGQGTKETVNAGKELFKGKEDIDLKTELKWRELFLVGVLDHNDNTLENHGLKRAWSPFLNKYMRLKVSLERKSRGEFVMVARQTEDTGETLNKMANIKNIVGAKT